MKPVHYTLWQIGPGGMELGVKHYSQHFCAKRKLYVYGIRPANVSIFDETKIEVRSGDEGKVRPYLQYFRYCRRYKNDIFHLQNGGPLILALTILAGVKNIVYHIHGTIYWRNNFQKLYLKSTWLIAKWLMRKAEVVFVANSRYSASIFIHKVMSVSLQVVYNGLEVSGFVKNKRLRTELKRIGYAGRLANGKNVDVVIRLFEEVAAAYPQVELHIAGDGTLRAELENLAAKSAFADRIKFLGFVKDIPAFYASVDLFVFLSAYESFGNVIAEALLTGLPTLTSNVPVFEEIYGQEKRFILGDPKEYETIVSRFREVMNDFPGLAEKAYRLSTSVEEQCSIENHLHQIESIYEKY